jgi:antitoxin component YwqK of YwqJK toxin-antitoxin module
MIGFGQCISGDCQNGFGTYLFNSLYYGDKYVGEWKNNKMHGTGTYYFSFDEASRVFIDSLEECPDRTDTLISFSGEFDSGFPKEGLLTHRPNWYKNCYFRIDTFRISDGDLYDLCSDCEVPDSLYMEDYYAIIPKRHTLEKLLPYNQKDRSGSVYKGVILDTVVNARRKRVLSGMCSAYSIATCRTILYARDNDLKGVDNISFESFSPYYTFLSVKSGTNDTIMSGMGQQNKEINQFGFIKRKDFEFPNYYPFTVHHISSFPKNIVDYKKEAIKYRFVSDHWQSGFESIGTGIDLNKKTAFDYKFDNNNIYWMKRYLSENNPAEVGFFPWPASMGSDFKGDYWDSSLKVICNEARNYNSEKRCSVMTNNPQGFCDNHVRRNNSDGEGKYWWEFSPHSVVLIGYDDEKYGGSFLILNSWGDGWGDNGKVWIPYDDILKAEERYGFHIEVSFCFKDTLFSWNPERKDMYISQSFGVNNLNDIKDNVLNPDKIKTISNDDDFDYNWMVRYRIVNHLGTYSGEKKNNLRQGIGNFSSENLFTYKGEWFEDLPNGRGLLLVSNKTNEGVFDGKFKDGNFFNGLLKFSYSDGNTKFEGRYKDGEEYGIWKHYHQNGKLSHEGRYKDGKEYGVWKYYYENGNLRVEKNYKNGLMNGVFKGYYEDGNLRIERSYASGKEHGIWKYYKHDGTLDFKIQVEN